AGAVRLDPSDPVTARLLRRGWVLEANAAGVPADVLRLPGTPFLLAVPHAEPLLVDGPTPHPVLWGFLGAARARSEARIGRERREALAIEEARPRSYVHQMRGAHHRWWRPLVALLLVVVGFITVSGAITVPFAVLGLLPEDESSFVVTTGANLWLNLVLAALIPVTLFAVWVAFRRSPIRVLSVTGRVRWGWLARCAAIVLPVWVVYLGASWVIFDQEVLPRPQDWVGLLVVTLLTTPLQAAGEEVAFRGGLVQIVGAWIPSERVALVVTTALSAVAFGLAHGSLDPWILIDVGSLAIAGCYLAWRTGGLEAPIAIHVVNNLLITVTGVLAGGLEESYIDTDTTGSALSTVPGVIAMVLVTVLLVRSAQRRGIAPPGWLAPARG
ncbi:MAG: CPBP family intramembrane glutamic endopeptidase, partial [Ornithinibacter sp.]